MGRKDIFSHLQAELSTSNYQRSTPKIWLHCASLGEFEQGRPLIEKIKAEQPTATIILTFFSPSGYEIRKNYALADYVFYLPLDSRKNAQRWLDLVQPTTAIFVKYEFWYYYLHTLQQRQIPTYLISAIFRPTQPFFRWYGRLHRQMLTFFTHLFIQNKTSAQLLQSIDIQRFSVVGDTRVDRVKSIADNAANFPLVEQFLQTENVLVAGSTWAADEAILVDFIHKNASLDWQFIFAPHEVNAANVERLKKLFQVPVVLYSELQPTETEQVRGENIGKVDGSADVSNLTQIEPIASTNSTPSSVLIIDNIGMLSALYQYAKIAYVGGGFGKAIHNILEPIAFGIPVLFGPRHTGFHEALALKASGGGFWIKSQQMFTERFFELQKMDSYQKAAQRAEQYIDTNLGATDAIYQAIFLP